MRSPPVDLATEVICHALEDNWGLRRASMEFVPEGGGSHHWKAVDGDGRSHFVTVDDLDTKPWMGATRRAAETGLHAALETAAALKHRAGLDFVVAPVAKPDGRLLHRLDDRYTVSLFPFLEGHAYRFAPHADPSLREAAVEMLAALHDSTDVVREQVPGHAPTFGGRRDLEAFLLSPERRWDGGPFGEAARRLFGERTADLAALLAAFDRTVEACASRRRQLVVTHGEPHPGNLMTVDGQLVLIDWDTVGLAPPERDLSLVAGSTGEGLERYERATGRQVDRRVVTLYRARWYLDDLASAVRMFRNPHLDDHDTRRWWEALPGRLGELSSWSSLLAHGAGTR